MLIFGKQAAQIRSAAEAQARLVQAAKMANPTNPLEPQVDRLTIERDGLRDENLQLTRRVRALEALLQAAGQALADAKSREDETPF